MSKNDLERRTLGFSLRVIECLENFPDTVIAEVLARQLLRAATSIGANYREANRSESKRDFIHKIGIVEKECSETQYWVEICLAKSIGKPDHLGWIEQEIGELLAIFSTINRKSKLTASKKKI